MSRRVLRGAALALVVVALMRPHWGTDSAAVVWLGPDVVLAVDVSASMAVRDVAPDRLSQARAAAGELVARLEGHRIGVMPFAGRAFMACPLTTDRGLIETVLGALHVDYLPLSGTSMAAAMRELAGEVELMGGSRKTRALVFLTDGEDLEGGVEEALAELRELGEVVVFGVLVGTEAGGEVPGRREAPVVSRVSAVTLSGLAASTGGRVASWSAGSGAVAEVVERIRQLDGQRRAEALASSRVERFDWFLLAAAVLLLGELVVLSRPGAGDVNRLSALATVSLVALAIGARADSGSSIDERTRAWMSDLQEQLAADPESPRLHYDLGTLLLEAGRAAEAVPHLERAARSPALAGRAGYNLAWAHGRSGRMTEAGEALRNVLRADPSDVEARVFLEALLVNRQRDGAGGVQAAPESSPPEPVDFADAAGRSWIEAAVQRQEEQAVGRYYRGMFDPPEARERDW